MTHKSLVEAKQTKIKLKCYELQNQNRKPTAFSPVETSKAHGCILHTLPNLTTDSTNE